MDPRASYSNTKIFLHKRNNSLSVNSFKQREERSCNRTGSKCHEMTQTTSIFKNMSIEEVARRNNSCTRMRRDSKLENERQEDSTINILTSLSSLLQQKKTNSRHPNILPILYSDDKNNSNSVFIDLNN